MADEPEVTAGSEPESMDDTMAAAYDAANPPEAPEKGEEAAPEVTPAEGGEAEETTEDQEAPEEAEAAAEEAPVDAPEGWSAEMKEAWAALPEHVRDYVAAKDKAAHAKLSEQGRTIATLKPVGDTLEQYRHTFEARGLDAHTAVKAMFEVQDRLDRDPVSAIRQIAQIYGVDLSQFTAQPQDDDVPAADPRFAALEQQLDAIQTQTGQDRLDRQSRENRDSQARIAEWAEDKGKDGQLLRPYFEKVRQSMSRLISAGEAADLDAAYDKAILLNPEIRVEIEAAKAEKAVVKAAKEAEAAKKRKRVNVGKSGDRTAPKGTWEDELGTVFDEMAAG